MMVLGNPLSGITSAAEMLPRPWGQAGQWLPPGAGSTLLRPVAYFGGARSGGLWATLAIWAAAGLTLIALSGTGGKRHGFQPAQTAAGTATRSRPPAQPQNVQGAGRWAR
jgi:hypothetical protein